MKIINDPESLENYIQEKYFMGYQVYAETKILSTISEDNICYKCNHELDPLTYLEKDFAYLPCWECSSKKKSDRQLITEGILRNIRDFYFNRIFGDRYLQLFIVDDIYFKNTLPHDYLVFKKILNSLDPPSRNDIWFLDWIPGYPKIISLDNISGLKIVNISENCMKITSEKDIIRVGDYEIILPELITYDPKHHSRYNLFNKNSNRKAKRLKFSGDRCIRFYNTDDENVKSIFKLMKNGEEVAIRSLSHSDFVIIKLAIMRNKTYLKLIFDVILEIMKNSGIFRDSIFLKNSINIDPSKDTIVNLAWTPIVGTVNPKYINISII